METKDKYSSHLIIFLFIYLYPSIDISHDIWWTKKIWTYKKYIEVYMWMITIVSVIILVIVYLIVLCVVFVQVVVVTSPLQCSLFSVYPESPQS